MNFFIRHREWFKGMAIASFLSLNFFMIVASYTGEDGAWIATFTIAGIAIVCSIIAQLIQNLQLDEETSDDRSECNDNHILHL